MFFWIYELPILSVVSLFALVFVGVCWFGIILFRRFVVRRIHHETRLNEILGDFLQYFGVIYGLLLGLLAVATYQNHTDVEKAVAGEASSLAALYRDISSYPEPDRTELKAVIREYPLNHRGCLAAATTGRRPLEGQSGSSDSRAAFCV